MGGLLPLTVVIPTWNEAREIVSCVEHLRALEPNWEVIVVDGGSTDNTSELARAAGASQVLGCRRGRGFQLAAGAAAASPNADLLFLHADCRLPHNAVGLIAETLDNECYSGGCFQVKHAPSIDAGPLVRFLLRTADWRSRRTTLPYGDQAVFCRRRDYLKIGGMPCQELMEDIEFSKRIAAVAPLRTLPAAVEVSGRRFCARPWHTFCCWHSFPLLYRLGVSPERLAKLY